MSGVAIGVGLVGAGLSTAMSLKAQGEAQSRAKEAQGIAAGNLGAQQQLTNEMMRQQREFLTATQVDADGNKIIYDPSTNSWIPLLSERGLQMQAAQRSAQELETRKYFGRGQHEETQAALRRQGEGNEADRLQREIANRYGAPTKEGVVGANKIAGVTAATEPADVLKRGASAATLRTGGSPSGLQTGYNALDKSSAQGVRTALAAADAGAGDAYTKAYGNWSDDKLARLKAHTAGAAAPGTAPPSSGMEALTAQIAARAAKGYTPNPYAGLAQGQATKSLTDLMGAEKDIDWAKAIGGLTDKVLSSYDKWNARDTTPKNYTGGAAP